MKAVFGATWTLFVGIALAEMSYGLQIPLLPLRAFDEGFDTSDTGLIMAGYFMGVLLGAYITPRLIKHVGHTKVFAAMASLASGAPLLYAIFVDPVVWFLFRAMTGVCFGALYIVAETWLNDRCTNETRGNVLNAYFMVLISTTGLGSLLLQLADPRGVELFVLASVLISFGIVPLLLSAKPAPSYETPVRLSIAAVIRKAPLGMGTLGIWGMSSGALFAAGPIYADKAGMTTSEVAVFMAMICLGSLIFMWPAGYLSDRLNRPRFLVALSSLAALLAVIVAITPPDRGIVFYGLTALFAGLTLAHYGLCLAVANDQLEPREMVGAGATLFICYSVGTVVGPILATEIIEAWQAPAYFWFLAGVHLLVVLYAIVLMGSGIGVAPVRKRQPSAAVTSLAGQLATSFALETARHAQRQENAQSEVPAN